VVAVFAIKGKAAFWVGLIIKDLELLLLAILINHFTA
jgi:hypothetical protein